MVDCYAIIVAGGMGSRMTGHTPKQFLLVQNKPLVMHTIEAFANSQYNPNIILVLPQNFIVYWEELCHTYNFQITHQIVAGGDTRYQSVKNALSQIADNSLVAVHDAARPLVSNKLIDACYEKAATDGSAVSALQTTDTVRQKNADQITQLDRENIYLMQTPQTFKISILKEAYHHPYNPAFTDDASVVQKHGGKISFVPGERTNIKVTWPDDLELAEIFLQIKKPSV